MTDTVDLAHIRIEVEALRAPGEFCNDPVAQLLEECAAEILRLREQLANAKTLGMIANSGPSLADIKLSLKGTETYQIVDGQWRRVENASVGTGSS